MRAPSRPDWKRFENFSSGMMHLTASLRFANLADDLLRAEALIAQHPGLGRPASFLSAKTPRAMAARTNFEALVAATGQGELREYILRGYLVLYLVQDDLVTFLSIRSARERGYSGV